MKRRSIIALASVALLVVLVAIVWNRRGSGTEPVDPAGKATAGAPPSPTRLTASTGLGQVGEDRVARDDDPVGELRLEGQVIDLEERPVAGAVVVIDSNPRREVRTESDGAFAFTGLVPRIYGVEARSGDAVAGPVGVRLSAGSEPIVLRLLPAAIERVQVVDADGGRPIAGALVELRDLAVTTATTGEDGRALIGGVSAGVHVIKASATGYAAVYEEILSAGAPGAISDTVLRLHGGATVRGQVIDPSGRPVEGARVVAESATTFYDLSDPRLDGVLTDAKGRFELGGLSRSTWRFLVSHPRFAPASSELVMLTGSRDDLVIRVSLGGELRGQVVDERGAPVVAAEVRVTGPSRRSGGTRYLRSDANGRFSLGGLPRSQIYVIASSEQATSPLIQVDLGRAGSRKDVTVPLQLGAVLEGLVVTSSGTPVPEARVTAVPALSDDASERVEIRLRGNATDVADGDGRFRLAPLEPGKYRVRAIRPGSASALLAMRAGAIVDSGARDIRVVVDDLTSLHGQVRFTDGAEPKSFVISLAGGAGRPFGGEGGRFRLADVPSGKQSLVVGGPELVRRFQAEIDLEPGSDNDLGTITVDRGRTVRGRVTDASGVPVAGATVVIGNELRADGWSLLVFDGSLAVKETATGADGRFTIGGLPSTEQVVCAEHEERGRAAVGEIAASKENAEVALTLQPFSSLQGTLRADGRPVAGSIFMRPTSASNALFTVDTGLDGTYRFDRMAPGKYLLFGYLERGSDMGGGGGAGSSVTLTAGQTMTADLDLTAGDITLTVALRSPGNAVEYGYVASVRVPEGTVMPPMPRTISDARKTLDAIGGGEVQEGFVVANRRIQFNKVKPGRYVVCANPLSGSPDDPEVLARIRDDQVNQLIYCEPTAVASSPPAQEISVTVQPAPSPPTR